MHDCNSAARRMYETAFVYRRTLLAICCATLLASCGSGGGDDGGSGGTPDGGGSGDGGGGDSGGDGGGGSALEAKFSSIQAQVFTPICTACHIGANAPVGLRLDEDNSYALLVDVPSGQDASLLRVDPGNPDDSYLIHKLEGTAASGGRMPLVGSPLPQADIDVIRQWITEGATDDRAATPTTTPVRITSMSPLPDSLLRALPARITLVLDREPDASTVNTETFILEASGGDGEFDDGDDVQITAASITVPASNSRSAVFDLTGVASADDVYRVRVLGSGASVVLDLDANALDGEFDGSFPAGDGTAGGDFVATFAVSGVSPTLASIQEQVFSPICSGCHSGPTSDALPAGLDLSDAEASHENLVGVASVEQPTIERVAAGDADASYLIHKLEGTAASGQQMPAGGPPLPASTIVAIRRWIDEGAEL